MKSSEEPIDARRKDNEAEKNPKHVEPVKKGQQQDSSLQVGMGPRVRRALHQFGGAQVREQTGETSINEGFYVRGGDDGSIDFADIAEEDDVPRTPLAVRHPSDWNKGDPVPEGGPLPFDTLHTKEIITAYRKYGDGTIENPMVLFSNSEVLYMEATDPEELRAYVSFAKRVARNLLFPYIWIRKRTNDLESRRNLMNTRRGSTKPLEHITVLLGNSADWVNVFGHVYIVVSHNGRKVEIEYMPEEQVMSQYYYSSTGGYQTRVFELWKWDEDGNMKEKHRDKKLHEEKMRALGLRRRS